MAILQTKTKVEDGIPPILDRRNGAGKPDVETLLARIAQLDAQVAAKGTLTFKVSEKGALSIYGMGRYPVSLYREQWERLLAQKDVILAFIEANADKAQRQGVSARHSENALSDGGVFYSPFQGRSRRHSCIQQSTVFGTRLHDESSAISTGLD
jgi:hypothetical protein